eukprot:Hpha_TRINITY_DN11271_c0_g1::TRINITY_DN11271_c0_g1_i1::g.167316::m.167316/K00024/mdh; malate dehydrogenase
MSEFSPRSSATRGYYSSINRSSAGLIGGVGLVTGGAPEKRMKVAVLGAAGGIGQTLSLFLKVHLPEGTHLHLFDVAPMLRGVAADVSHVDTQVHVHYHVGNPTERGNQQLRDALRDADVVAIVAGFARKPGMKRSDLFDMNAGVIRNLIEVAAHECPSAVICISTNPVNSLVPVAAEVLKAKGVYNPNKLIGVTLLDNMRSCAFINEHLSDTHSHEEFGNPVKEVPVIGGHSEETIVPLYSVALSAAHHEVGDDVLEGLYQRVRKAGTEVVEAKEGKGSATLSMGVANAYFVMAICDALQGKRQPMVCAMVDTSSIPDNPPFMAWPTQFNTEGAGMRLHLPALNEAEQAMMSKAMPLLRKDAELGKQWVQEQLKTLWSPEQ